MRQGFTQIPNNIFNLGLKPNELCLCVWILSHSEEFKLSLTKASKDLNMKFETVKEVIKRIEIKLSDNFDLSSEILKRLDMISDQSKIGLQNRTPKSEVYQLQNRMYPPPKSDVPPSKIGVLTPPKSEYKNIKENIKENNIKNISTVDQKKDNIIEKFKNDLFLKKDELVNLAGSRENLKAHYDFFMDYLENKKGTYKNPIAAFRNAIRGNWAKVARSSPQQMSFKVQDELLRQKKEADFEEKILEIVKKRKEVENDKTNNIFFKGDGF